MTTSTPSRAAARRARARRARARRAAVGDPAVLRHPRDDGRRHQPRGGGARLRHARADRRGRRRDRSTTAGPTTRATTGRSSCGARSRTHLERRYGVALRPGDRAADHGRRVRGGRPRAAGHLRPGRRGDPPRAVVRRLRPGDRVRRRRRPSTSRPGSRTTSRSTRRPSRPRSRRGRRRCSSATRATRPAPCSPTTSRTSWPRIARRPRPARVQRRDLRPAGVRHVPPPGVQRAAGDARADDPHGRLLEGLRDDRLAGRLAVPRRRGSSRGSSRSTSTGSCPRRRSPRTRRSRRSRAASRTSSGWSPSTTAAGGSLVDGLQRDRARGRSSRAARSTPSREVTPRPGLTSDEFAERLLREERVAVVPGTRSGRPARATSGCATRRPTSSSRRPSGGSAGSSSGSAPSSADPATGTPGPKSGSLVSSPQCSGSPPLEGMKRGSCVNARPPHTHARRRARNGSPGHRRRAGRGLRRQARRSRQPARHGPGARSVGRSVGRPGRPVRRPGSAYAGANR